MGWYEEIDEPVKSRYTIRKELRSSPLHPGEWRLGIEFAVAEGECPAIVGAVARRPWPFMPGDSVLIDIPVGDGWYPTWGEAVQAMCYDASGTDQ